jgi:hypothetical protein
MRGCGIFAAAGRGAVLDAGDRCAGIFDIMQGMLKSIVFAFILSTVGCYKGLTVRGGTQGVGRSTTQAVVISSVLIIVAGYIFDEAGVVFWRTNFFERSFEHGSDDLVSRRAPGI